MQQRRLLRQAALTNLFGTILFEINNWRYAYLSPQPTRRVFLPGNDTGLASVVDWLLSLRGLLIHKHIYSVKEPEIGDASEY